MKTNGKHLITSLLLLLLITSANSQINLTKFNPGNNVIVSKQQIFCNSTNRKDTLPGYKYSVHGILKNMVIDTIQNDIILFIKFPKSTADFEVICYNLDSEFIRWSYRTKCQTCEFFENYSILTYTENIAGSKKLFFLERKTGQLRRILENLNMLLIPDKEIMMAVPQSGIKIELEVLDKETFSSLGKVRVPGNYFLSSFLFNDSMLYVNINGIKAFDSDYKCLWNYDLDVMQRNYGSLLLSLGFSMGIGLLTGFVPFSYAPNFSIGLTSNTLVNNEDLFICDQHVVYSINKKNGTENWKTELPEKSAYSHISIINDSVIQMYNTSLCVKNGMINSSGNPFYSTYSVENGRKIFEYIYNESKFISDTLKSDNGLILLLNNAISIVSQDSLISYTIINQGDSTEDFLMFYSSDKPDTYFYYDSVKNDFTDLKKLHSNKNESLIVTQNKIVCIDSFKKITKIYSLNDVYLKLYSDKWNMYFEHYSHGTRKEFPEFVNYDTSVKQINRFRFDGFFYLKGRLYSRDKSSFYIIDL